jgi:hypothetical protein
MSTRAEKLGEALSNKGIDPACGVCGHNDWGGSEDAAVLLTGRTPSGQSGSVEVLPMTCTFCGHVRLHSPSHLGI